MTTTEAQEHLDAIANCRASIKTLMGTIRKHQTALVKIVVKAFNEQSEPIDGITVESREVVIGYASCDKSPIGVCVYSDRAMSIPGQLEAHAWREKHGHATAEDIMHKWGPATGTDACLFCGVPQDKNAKFADNRQLQPPKPV